MKPRVLVLNALFVGSIGCATATQELVPTIERLPDGVVPPGAPSYELRVPVRVCIDERHHVVAAAVDSAASQAPHRDVDSWVSAVDSLALMAARNGSYRAASRDGQPIGGCVTAYVVFNRGKRFMEPELVSMVGPDYPEQAHENREEGIVLVRVHVNMFGLVDEAVVIQSAGVALDAAALATAKSARFKPGRVEGQAVSVWVVIPVEFDLR